jgi:hypothetical protein
VVSTDVAVAYDDGATPFVGDEAGARRDEAGNRVLRFLP